MQLQHADGFPGSTLNPDFLQALGAWSRTHPRSAPGHFIWNLAAVPPFTDTLVLVASAQCRWWAGTICGTENYLYSRRVLTVLTKQAKQHGIIRAESSGVTCWMIQHWGVLEFDGKQDAGSTVCTKLASEKHQYFSLSG